MVPKFVIDDDPVARHLLQVAAAVLAVAGFALAAALTRDWPLLSARVLLHVGLGLAGATSLWLARARHLWWSAATLVGGYWLGATFVTLLNGGIRGPNLINYPLAMVLAGWLLGVASTVVMAVLTELVFIGLLIADVYGVLPPSDFENRVAYLIFLSAITGMTAAAAIVSRRGYLAKLAEAQLQARELAQREADLLAHRSQLEQEVRARTAELSEAKERAEQASRSKSTFLANMSHEIRTPLNVINGMAHMIREAGLSTDQRLRLNKLESASQHLLQVINDVLDLSKIEAGKMKLEVAPLQIERVVSNAVLMLRDRAQAKGLEVTTDLADISSSLEGDATRLQQALLNYGINAIKFTERGTVCIRTRVQQESADSVLLRFEVCDSGIGIDAATLKRLFSAFEQADNATTRKYGGTGLGLSITRQLASLMDGETGAVSQPGQGSTFWFTARLHKTQMPTPAQASPAPDAAEALRRQFAGLPVLVVDDEPVNLEIAAFLLRDLGMQVDEASGGRMAVQMAAATAYRAILMDVQMPDVDGLDATRQIRQLPGHAATPILATTGNAFREDRERCLAAGMNGFVAKPLDYPVLYGELLRLLQAR